MDLADRLGAVLDGVEGLSELIREEQPEKIVSVKASIAPGGQASSVAVGL